LRVFAEGLCCKNFNREEEPLGKKQFTERLRRFREGRRSVLDISLRDTLYLSFTDHIHCLHASDGVSIGIEGLKAHPQLGESFNLLRSDSPLLAAEGVEVLPSQPYGWGAASVSILRPLGRVPFIEAMIWLDNIIQILDLS
jgi:hypothetical protein